MKLTMEFISKYGGGDPREMAAEILRLRRQVRQLRKAVRDAVRREVQAVQDAVLHG